MSALDRPFSYSQISSYLRCPKSWDYRYKQGLTSLRPSVALRMGSLVDSGLEGALVGRAMVSDRSCASMSAEAILREFEAWSKGDGVSQALAMSQEFHDEAYETRNDAIRVARRVVDHLELDTDKWETMRDKEGKLGVQYEVRKPLRAYHHGYIGYIDWVPRRGGGVYIADLKVRKSLEDEEALRFDYQLASYEHAAGDAFGEIVGVAHLQTKSKPVSPPKVLKNGALSKAKNQSCDWPTYLRTVDEMQLDRAEYAEMKDKLPEFQRWTWTRRSKAELDNTWEEIEVLAERLVEAHHSTRPQPRVLNSRTCGTCDMRHVCMAELKGKDSEFIRRSMYKVREDYGPATN